MEIADETHVFKMNRLDPDDSPEKNSTKRCLAKSPSSDTQKLRFSIAHIMGFMNAGPTESKAIMDEEEEEEGQRVLASAPVSCDERDSNPALIPKLWKPTPTRDFVPTSADFNAMAILSRQYSLFGAAAAAAASASASASVTTTALTMPNHWKTNILTSAIFNSMQQDPFQVSNLSFGSQTAFARGVLHQQQQQQQLRHHVKSLFG